MTACQWMSASRIVLHYVCVSLTIWAFWGHVLHPMCTQVILRMGKWLHQAMYTHYLSFFKTEGLLAMGGWPHAQQQRLQPLLA